MDRELSKHKAENVERLEDVKKHSTFKWRERVQVGEKRGFNPVKMSATYI